MTIVELDYSGDGIVELMRTPVANRDPQWLRNALQQAVMLELATLPPYLCAWWSLIEDTESGEAASAAIKVIIFDEMSHLGHVCNMLTTIGGIPRLAHESVLAPYPCPLPGGIKPSINPELEVYLSGLTRDSARMFSEIEAPEKPLAQFAGDGTETFHSIGHFYTAILEAFRQHQGEITGKRQIVRRMEHHGAGNSLFAIRTIADVEKAIEIIKEQGEGTEQTPDNQFPGFEGELSHYYVFREIFRGKKLIKVQENPPKWDFTGADLPLPHARPMGRVPKGGWAKNPDTVPSPQVQSELDDFNKAFSGMLRSLESAWQQDDPAQADAALGEAVGLMFGLAGPAGNLMEIPLPKDPGSTYGPEFLYVPPTV